MRVGDLLLKPFEAEILAIDNDTEELCLRLPDGRQGQWSVDAIEACGKITLRGPYAGSDSSSPYVRDWNGGKIDIYRICQLWGANHPAQLHALKKILCAGQRGGGKDVDRDIREAIVALERWLEMRKEDAK